MKKIYTLAAGLLLASYSTMSAAEPRIAENVTINAVSPDGKYAVSSIMDELLTIINLETGEMIEYSPETSDRLYSLCNGNPISAEGTVIATADLSTAGVYWKGGEWLDLPGVAWNAITLPNSITPDGSRICGGIGTSPEIYATELAMTPYYWERKSDGSYSEPIALPYPEKDFTGRVPQYITAIGISDDGKTIVGQVLDYFGAMSQPIVYTEENGKWSYKLFAGDLLNPGNLTFPADPGPQPDMPKAKDYMTAEEFAAYENAQQEAMQGLRDWPEATEFMSDANKAAYEKAMAEYETAQNEWYSKFEKFNDVYWENLDAGATIFEYNQTGITGNGRYIYSNKTIEGESYMDPTTYVPFRFDLTNGDMKTYEGVSVSVTYIAENGSMLATTTPNPANLAYIVVGDADKFIPLEKYFEGFSTATVEWMKENMTHEYENFDWETGESKLEEAMATGLPTGTPDLTTIATWQTNFWDFESPVMYYSYVFDGLKSGISPTEIGTTDLVVTGSGNGILNIKGEAAMIEVYDLNGRLVFSASNPGTSVSTGLGHGAYIVKATDAKGSTTTLKAVF